MQDVWNEVEAFHHHDYGLLEEGVTFTIIVVAVDTWPLEVVFVVDEEVFNSVHFQGEDPAVLVPPANWNVEVALVFQLFPVFFRHVLVKGQSHADLIAVFGQLVGQGAQNIA